MSEGAQSRERAGRPGSMAQEAAKLVDVAHLWLVGAAGAASASSEGPEDVWAEATTEAGSPPPCRGCPVCRVRAALDGVSPEVYLNLAQALASVGAAIRAMDGDRHDGAGQS